jgi:hypothetical protein
LPAQDLLLLALVMVGKLPRKVLLLVSGLLWQELFLARVLLLVVLLLLVLLPSVGRAAILDLLLWVLKALLPVVVLSLPVSVAAVLAHVAVKVWLRLSWLGPGSPSYGLRQGTRLNPSARTGRWTAQAWPLVQG